MPKNKFEDAIFTIIMATIMVYGMVVYNVALNTHSFSALTFALAVKELPIMVPIAFVLEFFIVGKLAKMIAFKIVTPESHPLKIVVTISSCICFIMCPTMSLIATFLFKDPSVMVWFKTFIMNLPMALCWQLVFCGPFVRFIFGLLFPRKETVEA